MKSNEKTNLADRLRDEMFTTKEDLLSWLEKERARIDEKARTDKRHSAAFYYAYTKMIDIFYKKIQETVLFNHLEDYWYYSIGISSSSADLSLVYTPKCWLDDSGKLQIQYGQSLLLLYVKGKFLTVEEYAAEYGVGAGTVRQWIRRGKIRTARKEGNTWMIPELTEMPGRGFQSAAYTYSGHLNDLPQEYDFLEGHTAVLINQSFKDKNKYEITVASSSDESKTIEMDTKNREKFELFLISRPDVLYVEGPLDGLNVSITSKTYVNEWLCK